MATIKECNCIYSAIEVIENSLILEASAKLAETGLEKEEFEHILDVSRSLSNSLKEYEENCPDGGKSQRYEEGKDLLYRFLSGPGELNLARDSGGNLSVAVHNDIKRAGIIDCK